MSLLIAEIAAMPAKRQGLTIVLFIGFVLFIFIAVWYWNCSKRSKRNISFILWANLLVGVYAGPVAIFQPMFFKMIKEGRTNIPEEVFLTLEFMVGTLLAVGLRFLLFGKTNTTTLDGEEVDSTQPVSPKTIKHDYSALMIDQPEYKEEIEKSQEMAESERKILEELYAKSSNETLLKKLAKEPDEYAIGAYGIMLAEIKKRNLL